MYLATKFSGHLAEKITHDMKDGLIKDWLNDFVPSAVSLFWSIIAALLILFIVVQFTRGFRKACKNSLIRHDAEEGVITFMDGLLKALGYIIAIFLILSLFGVTTGTIVAAVGSLGVTAGLALQGSLSNFAGGVLILILHPFKVGDYICEDTHKNEGTVEEITIFYTKLVTVDHKVVMVPNGELVTNSLTNYTLDSKRMVNEEVSISYEDDIKTAKEVIQQVIESEEFLLEGEPILVFVSELADSSVKIGYRFFIPTDKYMEVKWRTFERIKYALDQHGISIPYNQLDVHVRERH